jgi:hypothetical protein
VLVNVSPAKNGASANALAAPPAAPKPTITIAIAKARRLGRNILATTNDTSATRNAAINRRDAENSGPMR